MQVLPKDKRFQRIGCRQIYLNLPFVAKQSGELEGISFNHTVFDGSCPCPLQPIINLAYQQDLLEQLAVLFGGTPLPLEASIESSGIYKPITQETIISSDVALETSCSVWIPLESTLSDSDPLCFFPTSHSLWRQSRKELGLNTCKTSQPDLSMQPFWSALLCHKGINPLLFHLSHGEALITLPGISYGCSGNALPGDVKHILRISYAIELPHQDRSSVVITSCSLRPLRPVQCHLDSCFSIGDGRILLLGWSTDISADATIELIINKNHTLRSRLGPARINRPDVKAAHQLETADVGFLLALQLNFSVVEVSLPQGTTLNVQTIFETFSFYDCFDFLVDACQWMFTPSHRLNELLNCDLGVALQWLEESVKLHDGLQMSAGLSTTDHDHNSRAVPLIVEVDSDRDLLRCRLGQLQSDPAVLSQDIIILIRNRSSFVPTTSLPDWIINDSCKYGLLTTCYQRALILNAKQIFVIEKNAPPTLPSNWLCNPCSDPPHSAHLGFHCISPDTYLASDSWRSASLSDSFFVPAPSRRSWRRAIEYWSSHR